MIRRRKQWKTRVIGSVPFIFSKRGRKNRSPEPEVRNDWRHSKLLRCFSFSNRSFGSSRFFFSGRVIYGFIYKGSRRRRKKKREERKKTRQQREKENGIPNSNEMQTTLEELNIFWLRRCRAKVFSRVSVINFNRYTTTRLAPTFSAGIDEKDKKKREREGDRTLNNPRQ